MLLDAANSKGVVFDQHDEPLQLYVMAVAIRCPHSKGTPGLVMSIESYLQHRRICAIEHVATRISDLQYHWRKCADCGAQTKSLMPESYVGPVYCEKCTIEF